MQEQALVRDATGAIKPIREVVGNAVKSSNLVYNEDVGQMLRNNMTAEERIIADNLENEKLGVKGSESEKFLDKMKEKEAKLEGIIGDSTVARVLDKIGNDTSDALGIAKVNDRGVTKK